MACLYNKTYVKYGIIQLLKQFINLYLTDIVDPNAEPDEDTFSSLMHDTSKRYVSLILIVVLPACLLIVA